MRVRMYKMLEEMAIAGSSDEQLAAAAKKAFGFSPTLKEIKRVRANVRPVRFRGGVEGDLPNLSLNDVLGRQAMEKASRAFVARLCADAFERDILLPNMTRQEQLTRALEDPDFNL